MPVEVELDVFSGRPNPKWTLGPKLEEELFKRINSLAPAPGTSAIEPPGLGYRGFLLNTGNRRIRVYGGVVELGDEARKDPSRGLENWLLETATTPIDAGLVDHIKGELS